MWSLCITKKQSPLIGGGAKEGENQLPKPEDELPDFCYGWKEHGVDGDAVTVTQYHVNDFNLVFRSTVPSPPLPHSNEEL